MTSKSEKFKALLDEFGAGVAALLDECEDPSAARKAATAVRPGCHPRVPYGASLVKVFFTGDRDGNTFAVCHPTGETKRIKVEGYSNRQGREVWKYTYENQTGTANKRSWVGMLKTLDGHGRKVTKIQVFRPGGMETITL